MAENLSLIEKVVARFAPDFRRFDAEPIPPALRDFQCEWFGPESRQRDERFARWLYLERPSNALLYCQRDDRVVGTQGVIGFETQIGERRVSGACTIDLRVRPEWKMKGLGVALIGSVLCNYDIALGVGISEEARNMFARQGWVDLGRTDRFIKPIRAKGLESVHSTALSRALRLFAAPVTLALRVVDAWLTRGRLGKSVRIEPLERFLPEHDSMLSRMNAAFALCVPRSSEYLNWRYFGSAVRGRYRVFAVSEDGEFKGYVTTAIGRRDAKRVLALSDLQCDPQYADTLLRHCIRYARAERIDAIYYQGVNPRMTELLRRFLFIRRDGGLLFMTFTRHADLKPIVAARSSWCINMSDSDSDFGLIYGGADGPQDPE
jgi:hypothetical protein